MVDRIMKWEETEEEVDNMIALLRKNVVDPYVTDYIYYEENTPEEVVDKALAYKPIILWLALTKYIFLERTEVVWVNTKDDGYMVIGKREIHVITCNESRD